MCSFAVIAESFAEREGIGVPTTLGRRWLIVPAAITLAFGTMFFLHKVDQYRAARRIEDRSEELQTRMPEMLSLFSSEVKDFLTKEASERGV
jgi:hypothetical protein